MGIEHLLHMNRAQNTDAEDQREYNVRHTLYRWVRDLPFVKIRDLKKTTKFYNSTNSNEINENIGQTAEEKKHFIHSLSTD